MLGSYTAIPEKQKPQVNGLGLFHLPYPQEYSTMRMLMLKGFCIRNLAKFSMMSTATRSPLYCGMSAFVMLLPYLLRDCALSSTIRAVRAKDNVCLLSSPLPAIVMRRPQR